MCHKLINISVLLVMLLQLTCAFGDLPAANLDGRIVGGMETSILHFPHQVSIQMDGTYICGGAIIKPNVILTAAHCIIDQLEAKFYKVRAGSTNQRKGGYLRTVTQLIPHELYNEPTPLNNDIALLVLSEALQYNRYIRPISLITAEDILPEKAALFVSGWGLTSSDAQQVEERLRYTVVHELDQQHCALAYKDAGIITETMLCAGLTHGGQDSCQGDSGGPLITGIHGALKLYGVVSWGIGCAQAEYPGVYTRTTPYIKWIQQKLASLS